MYKAVQKGLMVVIGCKTYMLARMRIPNTAKSPSCQHGHVLAVILPKSLLNYIRYR